MPIARRSAVAVTLAVPALRHGVGQPVPEAPLRLVVPFPPRGAVDLIARALEGPLAHSLGLAFVVENGWAATR